MKLKNPKKQTLKVRQIKKAAGDSEQLLAPSAKEFAQFDDPNKKASEFQPAAGSPQDSKQSPELLTAQGIQPSFSKPQETKPTDNALPDAAELINRSYELSGLIASLDDKHNNQARKARKRAVSASIHRASDALYLDTWRRKIEQIGNLNYPEKAKQQEIFGNLTLKVALNKDGTINQLAVIESSGKKILDDAAIRIVRLSAPFSPLTQEMSKDTDILEIIRVWAISAQSPLKNELIV